MDYWKYGLSLCKTKYIMDLTAASIKYALLYIMATSPNDHVFTLIFPISQTKHSFDRYRNKAYAKGVESTERLKNN